MKQRRLLQKQIIEAWNQCIANDYNKCRINSERSLQASFWSYLVRVLPQNRRLFIEPSIQIQENNLVYTLVPDLVICNTRAVIAVIELKYRPRTGPLYSKDINSLSAIAKYRAGIALINERYRGQSIDATVYHLSQHILFVWAGVHAVSRAQKVDYYHNAPYCVNHEDLNGCFLELHAETSPSADPKVYSKSG